MDGPNAGCIIINEVFDGVDYFTVRADLVNSVNKGVNEGVRGKERGREIELGGGGVIRLWEKEARV